MCEGNMHEKHANMASKSSLFPQLYYSVVIPNLQDLDQQKVHTSMLLNILHNHCLDRLFAVNSILSEVPGRSHARTVDWGTF